MVLAVISVIYIVVEPFLTSSVIHSVIHPTYGHNITTNYNKCLRLNVNKTFIQTNDTILGLNRANGRQ